MSTQIMVTGSTTFKIGWIILLVISVLFTLGHLMLMLVSVEEAPLFIGWAAYKAYSSAVLYIPFRRGEKWAWYTSWILVVGFASTIFFNAQIGPYYLGAAILMAAGLLLTRPAFVQKG